MSGRFRTTRGGRGFILLKKEALAKKKVLFHKERVPLNKLGKRSGVGEVNPHEAQEEKVVL